MHTDPEVLALVALGERNAASAEELSHIEECPVCGREVTELGDLTRVGRTISDHFTLEAPSPQVWDRIRAELGFSQTFSSPLIPPSTGRQTSPPDTPAPGTRAAVRAVPDPPAPPALPAEPPRRRRRVLALALAAVLAVLAGVGGTLAWQQLHQGDGTPATAVQLNAMPTWAGASGEATLVRDPDGTSWLEVSMATPRPVSGTTEVWLMNRDATATIPIGAMTTSPQRLQIPAGVDVRTYPVVDVSVEPGPNPSRHSGDSIVRGTLGT